jgi:hypothetical protein
MFTFAGGVRSMRIATNSTARSGGVIQDELMLEIEPPRSWMLVKIKDIELLCRLTQTIELALLGNALDYARLSFARVERRTPRLSPTCSIGAGIV